MLGNLDEASGRQVTLQDNSEGGFIIPNTPTQNSYLDAMDAQIAAKHLLQHPFYQAWTRGELTREALRDYAAQYYQHVAAFPTYLSALHSHTEDAAARRHILANLIEEEAGSPNHPELWLQFAEGMGVNRDEVQSTQPWKETANLIQQFRSACRDRSTAEGLAALYAYESQIPAVAESKIAGLKQFYGITQPETLAYFQIHIEADKEHAAIERALLDSRVDDGNAAAVSETVAETLDALYGILDGVCRRHLIAC
jgi:pyrroloquinoline-quinone synthase